jgi:Apea-like HEPN
MNNIQPKQDLIETIDNISYYAVESYAFFKNIDSSALAINPYLEKFGYKFVAIDLQDLEKNFSSLFTLPKYFVPEDKVSLHNQSIEITYEFYEALINSPFYSFALLEGEKVIFLKKSDDTIQKEVNNTIEIADTAQTLRSLKDLSDALLQQFRLFKNGHIECPIRFQMRKESRAVFCRTIDGNSIASLGLPLYSLTTSEVETFGHNFSETFSANSLSELAISNFNLAYRITDQKTKYITLMTCLESLLNLGKEQITHTVSRHLALIISTSETDFQLNYTRMKKLYDIRSQISHGKTTKEDFRTK